MSENKKVPRIYFWIVFSFLIVGYLANFLVLNYFEFRAIAIFIGLSSSLIIFVVAAVAMGASVAVGALEGNSNAAGTLEMGKGALVSSIFAFFVYLNIYLLTI